MKTYLEFIEVPNLDRKTKIFSVFNKDNKTYLGEIKWWGAWRQYCFFPIKDTLFNKSCLLEIVEFIEKIMNERKNRGFI